MKLSVLIAAMPHRPHKEITAILRRQAEQCGGVEVLCEVDDGLSGPKRQRLLEAAQGDYIAFVDDDDKVADDYVCELLEAARSGADVLTFNLDFYRNGHLAETWQFGPWPNQRRKGKMQLNHLCAWRREIARKVAWCPDLGHNDDHLWFDPLYQAGLVKTTHHIDLPLYEYRYAANQTVNQSARIRKQSAEYMRGGKRCWLVGGEIIIEHKDGMARDRDNSLVALPDTEPYYLAYPLTARRELGVA